MEAVRRVIDSDLLMGVVPLPRSFHSKKIEIIVFVKEENNMLPQVTKGDIDSMLAGSVTESLIGALPQSNKTLDDYRSERLSKYETIN